MCSAAAAHQRCATFHNYVSSSLRQASRIVIITDENVGKLYLQQLVDAFVAAGHTPLTFQITPGEGSKCRAYKEQIEV